MMEGASRPGSAFAALRQFARRSPRIESCELCHKPLFSDHPHLLDPVNRQLMCCCIPCAILFDSGGQTKFKRVPKRIRRLDNFELSENQWNAMMVPINLAFFVKSSPLARVVAMYPSPAGATESSPALDAWAEIEDANPVLRDMDTDVESLLVNRVRGSQVEYYIVPVDQCFKLVGLIRNGWRGLSGGTEVWAEIGRFFDVLRAEAVPFGESANA